MVTTLARPGLTWAGWEMTTPDTGSPDRGTDTEARAMEVRGPERLVIGDTTGLFWLNHVLSSVVRLGSILRSFSCLSHSRLLVLDQDSAGICGDCGPRGVGPRDIDMFLIQSYWGKDLQPRSVHGFTNQVILISSLVKQSRMVHWN